MAADASAKIQPGDILASKYRVIRSIGRGGMATVYEAENQSIAKRVAVKVLSADLTASNTVVERFLREARAAASVRSPYICDVYDSGRIDSGQPYLVLELLEGESLYEHMTRVREMDVATTLTIVSQVCRGLAKAHSQGIVHRDLKPENIFLTRDEDGNLLCKILDFGLAKFYEGSDDNPRPRLTREGAVFGTPAYMSPEQVRGQNSADQRADLWALACITYECLTGRTVWNVEQGVAMTFAQIAGGNLPDPLKFRPDLPPEFGQWFKRALDRKIENRQQSPQAVIDELLTAFGFQPQPPNPLPPWAQTATPKPPAPRPNDFADESTTVRIDASQLGLFRPGGAPAAQDRPRPPVAKLDDADAPTTFYSRPEGLSLPSPPSAPSAPPPPSPPIAISVPETPPLVPSVQRQKRVRVVLVLAWVGGVIFLLIAALAVFQLFRRDDSTPAPPVAPSARPVGRSSHA